MEKWKEKQLKMKNNKKHPSGITLIALKNGDGEMQNRDKE